MNELPTHIVATGGIIFNDDNKVLLMNNPRKGWEYPGGIVENGETIQEAIIREVKEETGVNVKVRNIVGVYSNTKGRPGYNGVKYIPTKICIDFILDYIDGEFIENEEAIETKWFTIEEAKEVIRESVKFRFINAINYMENIYLLGYSIENNKVKISEDLKLKRNIK